MPDEERERAAYMNDPTKKQREAMLEVLKKGDGLSTEDLAEVLAFAVWNREQAAYERGASETRWMLYEAVDAVEAMRSDRSWVEPVNPGWTALTRWVKSVRALPLPEPAKEGRG